MPTAVKKPMSFERQILIESMASRTAAFAKQFKPKTAKMAFDKATMKMAELIHTSDFGCQKGNVAQLMEAATGKKVVEAYDMVSKAPAIEFDAATGAAAGIMITLTSIPRGSRLKVGDSGVLWRDDATSFRFFGVEDIRFDHLVGHYRPATKAEIIAYITKDRDYVASNYTSFISCDPKKL